MAWIWQKFCQNLEQVVSRRPQLEWRDLRGGTGVAVQFPDTSLEIEVVVPNEVECVVAEKVVPARNRNVTLKVLDEMGRLGMLLGSGSVLADTTHVSDSVWEDSQYQKQYYLPVTGPEDERPDLDSLINSGKLRQFRGLMERLLGIPVELECYMDERPYILSLDYHGPAEEGKKPPFHFYIHLYELTGAVYIEKVELPEAQRGNGYGTQLIDYLKWLARSYNLSYIYLEAKTTAEPFWERHGFEYLYRLNLRRSRRREKALRRRPGWERSWVGDYRLQRPYWQYKNHPQDDIDLVGGLLAMDRSWEALADISA